MQTTWAASFGMFYPWLQINNVKRLRFPMCSTPARELNYLLLRCRIPISNLLLPYDPFACPVQFLLRCFLVKLEIVCIHGGVSVQCRNASAPERGAFHGLLNRRIQKCQYQSLESFAGH